MLLCKSHMRNYDTRLRNLLFVFVAAITLLFVQSTSVLAAPASATGEIDLSAAIPLDKLCVDGLVINHQEQPLSGGEVTAASADTGVFDTQVSDNNGEVHFDLDATGTWHFSINVPAGWVALTEPAFDVHVSYGNNDCLSIRFKVEQRIEVIVIKIDDEHTPLEGWTIIATPGPNNPYNKVHKAITNEEGRATFGLPPGHWIFTEQAPANTVWWTPVMPVNGEQEFTVKAPGPYVIRFKNDVKVVKYGCIRVIKQDLPPEGAAAGSEPFGLPGWPIDVIRADGSIADSGATDAFGQVIFSNLPFGPYVVQEQMLDGWEPVTPTTYRVELKRDDKDCHNIVFTNKQKEKGFCFEGKKEDVFGKVGIAGWEIYAEPTEIGDIVPKPVLTDGQGRFRIDFPFDDYRVPGSTYLVCEEERDGWTPVGPTCYKVTLPKYPKACTVVPTFINQQTNEKHPRPHTEFPEKHDGGKHQGNQHDGNKHGHPGHHGGCSDMHKVQKGETVSSVAKKYGVAAHALVYVNPQVDAHPKHWLFVGQQICIP